MSDPNASSTGLGASAGSVLGDAGEADASSAARAEDVRADGEVPEGDAAASPSERGPFRLDRFRLLTTATALISVLAFCTADGKPVLLLLALSIATISMITVSRAGFIRLPRFVINGLVLVSLLYATLMIGLRPEVISDLTDFLAIVLMLKMLDRTTARDEAQLLGLSIFVIIGAVLTGAQLSLGMTLIVYMPMAIASVTAWQVYRGIEDARMRSGTSGVRLEPTPRAWGGSLISVTALVIVLSFAVGLVGFLLIPRNLLPGSSAWGRPLPGAVTGFSDTIKLGAAGLLSESSEAVMDVILKDEREEVLPPGTQPLYLRGAVLDEYDSKTKVWRRSENARSPAPRTFSGRIGSRIVLDQPSLERSRGLMFDDAEAGAESPSGPSGGEAPERGSGESSNGPVRSRNVLVQEITIRSTNSTGIVPLFCTLRPISIDLSTTVQRFEYDHENTILRRTGDPGRVQYVIRAALDYFRDEPAATPKPDGISMPLRRLAEQIRRAAEVSEGPESYGPLEIRRIARQIESHLRRTCGYTLEMVAPQENEDPIEMFLFRTQRGHCEYFATSMATLCRAVGVPARVVTGYVGGEFNSVSKSYLIRASDAHAWVEVQTSPGRWETFDPTPPAELQHNRRAGLGIFTKVRELWEALEISWGQHVIAFDQSKGSSNPSLAGSFDGEGLRSFARRIASVRQSITSLLPRTPAGAITLLAVLSAAGTGVYLGRRALRRLLAAAVAWLRRMALRQDGQHSRVPGYYREALRALARAGIRRPEGLTARQFAVTLRRRLPAVGGPLLELTERYYAARFGDVPAAGDEQSLLEVLLASLRAAQAEAKTSGSGRGLGSGWGSDSGGLGWAKREDGDR